MINEQTRSNAQGKKNDSGMPGGGAGRRDEVGKSGVYPVSDMKGASPDAVVHGERSFGQGERGAEGYNDSGSSEISYLGNEPNGEQDEQ